MEDFDPAAEHDDLDAVYDDVTTDAEEAIRILTRARRILKDTKLMTAVRALLTEQREAVVASKESE